MLYSKALLKCAFQTFLLTDIIVTACLNYYFFRKDSNINYVYKSVLNIPIKAKYIAVSTYVYINIRFQFTWRNLCRVQALQMGFDVSVSKSIISLSASKYEFHKHVNITVFYGKLFIFLTLLHVKLHIDPVLIDAGGNIN